jgi:hypothetical protein
LGIPFAHGVSIERYIERETSVKKRPDWRFGRLFPYPTGFPARMIAWRAPREATHGRIGTDLLAR